MNDCTIRTRLKERPIYFSVKSLDDDHVSNFIQNTKLHNSPTGLAYLELIINHFTEFSYKARQLARQGTFRLLKNRQAVYRPGQLANEYFLVITGQLGQLQQGEFRVYQSGEGVGDQEMYLKQQTRTSYVFQSSSSLTILCRMSLQTYRQLFRQRVEVVEKYEEMCSSFELFNVMEKSRRLMLLKDAQEIEVIKGQRLYQIGEAVKGVYVVVQGMFKETIDHKEKRKGEMMPEQLNQIEDFREYVLSYEVLRMNEQVSIKSRLTHKQNDAIGLNELYLNKLERTSSVRALRNSRVLFFYTSSLRRHALVQIIHNRPVFEMRRRSRTISKRGKSICTESTKTQQSEGNIDMRCRKLVYARNIS